jgi:WD40 repeat protein
MKKSTQSKATTKKPAAKPAAKPTTKPATKPSSKPAPKQVAKDIKKKEDPKKPCDKKKAASNTKEKEISVDKRAFVSGEAPKKVEKIEIKVRTSMNCIKTVKAHDDWVKKAIILSSGKIATIGLDALIKIWDIDKDTKKPLIMMGDHTSGVTDIIEFAKNKIITVSNDKTIRKWNVETGKELFCYKTDQPLNCVKKIDDNLIAVGGIDKSVYIYDFSKDSVNEEEYAKIQVARMEEHKDILTSLELTDDKRLISASGDKTICIWDLNNYKLIKTLQGHTEGVQCLKILKDGTLASGSFDDTIKIWDLKNYTCIKTLKGHTGHVYSLNQLPDGKLISGASDWSLIAWDLEKGEQVFTLEGHEECVNSIDVFPDGKILTSSTDQTVKLWD